MLDSVSWAGYDFICFLLIVSMQFFFKDIEFVHLSLPPVPSKPSAFASVPVTCALFTVFLSLRFLSLGFG